MKIGEFLDVSLEQLQRMTDAQLRDYVKGGAKIANQRITRLKNADMTASPAYQALPAKVKKGGFQTAKLSRQQLLNAATAEQRFVRGRTSTVIGWKAEMKRADKYMDKATSAKARYGYDASGQLVKLGKGQKSAMTQNQNKLYWQLFNKGVEAGWIPKGTGKYNMGSVGNIILSVIKSNPHAKKSETLERELSERFKQDYERQQQEEQANREDIFSAGKGKSF